MNKEDFLFNDRSVPVPEIKQSTGGRFPDMLVYCLIGITMFLLAMVIYMIFTTPSNKPTQINTGPPLQQQQQQQMAKRPKAKQMPTVPPTMTNISPEKESMTQSQNEWAASRDRSKERARIAKNNEERSGHMVTGSATTIEDIPEQTREEDEEAEYAEED